MPIAKEGFREIAISTVVLAALAFGGSLIHWSLAIPFIVVWLWVLSFFRDPKRVGEYQPGDLCSPADGTITEISELDHHDCIDGPAVRIGMFLSLFNVHINRSPCAGTVRDILYKEGEFLDARHPECGERNESNTLVIDPESSMSGPVVVRQISGLVARRIICNVKVSDKMPIGYRFGLIKFGSRTELIIPRVAGTEIKVGIGDSVRGGLTILASQPLSNNDSDRATVEAPEKLAKVT